MSEIKKITGINQAEIVKAFALIKDNPQAIIGAVGSISALTFGVGLIAITKYTINGITEQNKNPYL